MPSSVPDGSGGRHLHRVREPHVGSGLRGGVAATEHPPEHTRAGGREGQAGQQPSRLQQEPSTIGACAGLGGDAGTGGAVDIRCPLRDVVRPTGERGRRRRHELEIQEHKHADAGERPDEAGDDDVPRGSGPSTAGRPRPDQPEQRNADDAVDQPSAKCDDTQDEGVDGECDADADQQRRLVVRAERVDGEGLDPRRHGVDHSIADVEHRRAPRAMSSRHQFSHRQRGECADQPGQCGQDSSGPRPGVDVAGSTVDRSSVLSTPTVRGGGHFRMECRT